MNFQKFFVNKIQRPHIFQLGKICKKNPIKSRCKYSSGHQLRFESNTTFFRIYYIFFYRKYDERYRIKS